MNPTDITAVKKAATIIKTLNNKHRMEIIRLLHQNAMTGRELREAFTWKKGYLDNQLVLLRNMKLVRPAVDQTDLRARIYNIDKKRYESYMKIIRQLAV